MWKAGKSYDSVNTCHSVALRGWLGRKNALYKYLIFYFLLYTLQLTPVVLPIYLPWAKFGFVFEGG